MLKIKVKCKNDAYFVTYKSKHTNTIETLSAIWYLIDVILRNDENISKKELMDWVENGEKYIEEMESK